MAGSDHSTLEIDLSSLSLNVNMVGISLAIFTFILFFGYTTSASKNPILLQLTLGVNAGAVFSFALSALYYYVLLYSRPSKHPKVGAHSNRATVCFSIGLLALLLEPALILFTIKLYIPAVVALVFFLVYVPIYVLEYGTIRSIIRAKPPPSGDTGSESPPAVR